MSLNFDCSVSRSRLSTGNATKMPIQLMQHPVRILEGESNFGLRTLGLRRIRNAPVCGHRLPWPDGTGFAGCVVANGEDEIQSRRAGLGEFGPRLRTKFRRVVAEAAQELQRIRIDLAFGLASGAVCTKFSRADLVQYRFGDDRSGGVAGAKEQDIVWFFEHDLSPPSILFSARTLFLACRARTALAALIGEIGDKGVHRSELRGIDH